ncbi:DUF6302 family protein [Streptomyces albipurpureus]|uniref:DUF6302 family protein n=1 Tax=Streptomyces albipurpureus TaxID=2897419 RepID=A0ABT0UK08_9ACTN|nr:DUF6302 family protein [Streptomyces sp. CWNU-1]MCM2388785.1 DUF6302 family protein [Streptomyces sp. CWNU-1]
MTLTKTCQVASSSDYDPAVVPPLSVVAQSPHLAYDYDYMVGRLADPSLLANAVAVRVFRAPLLAVPVGGTRLGGVLEAPTREIAKDVVGALAGRSGFPDVRLRPTRPQVFLVEWGASCPPELHRVARGRFYGLAAGDGGLASARDAVVLDAVAQNMSARTLTDCRLYPSPRDAYRGVAALGRALADGRAVRWTRIVHLAISRCWVSAPPSAQARTLAPWPLDLLRAWAGGVSLPAYADRAALAEGDARELRQLVLLGLGARGDQHAVLRGHETGLLHTAIPPVAYGPAPDTAARPAAGASGRGS